MDKNTFSASRALENAYLTHRERLLTLAAAFVDEKPLAEDVVHDVFVWLAAEPGRLVAGDGLGPYLTVAVRNRAVSILRDRRRRAALVPENSESAGAADTADPAFLVGAAQEAQVLLGLVAALPDDLKDVIALRIWGELGFREIARIQGVSESTAHGRYREALENLKSMMRGNKR